MVRFFVQPIMFSVYFSLGSSDIMGLAGVSRPQRAWREERGSPRCLWTLGHVPEGWAPDPSSEQMRQAWVPETRAYDPTGREVYGAAAPRGVRGRAG